MRSFVTAIAAAAIALPAAPAYAQYGGSPDDQQEDYPEAVADAADQDMDRDDDRDDDPDYDDDRDYDPEDARDESGEADRGGTWRGDDGRTYCRRSDGTTGLDRRRRRGRAGRARHRHARRARHRHHHRGHRRRADRQRGGAECALPLIREFNREVIMRKVILGLLAAIIALPVLSVPAAAKEREDYDRYYDREGNYSGPTWRGNDGRMYCRKRDGTTGLIVGAVAGALVGRGDRPPRRPRHRHHRRRRRRRADRPRDRAQQQPLPVGRVCSSPPARYGAAPEDEESRPVAFAVAAALCVSAAAAQRPAPDAAATIRARQANYKQMAAAMKGISDQLRGVDPSLAAIRRRQPG